MNEQAKVGIVVILAAVLLTAALFAIANIHPGTKAVDYKAYFKFGGGMEPGAPVRFAGLKVGRVNEVVVDPQDATRVEVRFQVKADTPIRSDSLATISALTPLTENYIEITPGKSGTVLPAGSVVPSQEMQDIQALIRKMSGLADTAQPLIVDLRANLNKISERADVLLAQLNDVTGPDNRQHFGSILKETDGMIKTNSPKVDATLTNLKDATDKFKPLMDDLKNTNAKLQKVMDSANEMVAEDREPLRKSLLELEKTLVSTRATVEQLQSTLVYNNDNIDSMLENFRQISENIREFSDTVKQKPYSLIRVKNPPERVPPAAPKESKPKPAGKAVVKTQGSKQGSK